MYELHPPRVFVHKRVYTNAAAAARLERMLRALSNPPIVEVGVGVYGAGEDVQARGVHLFRRRAFDLRFDGGDPTVRDGEVRLSGAVWKDDGSAA